MLWLNFLGQIKESPEFRFRFGAVYLIISIVLNIVLTARDHRSDKLKSFVYRLPLSLLYPIVFVLFCIYWLIRSFYKLLKGFLSAVFQPIISFFYNVIIIPVESFFDFCFNKFINPLLEDMADVCILNSHGFLYYQYDFLHTWLSFMSQRSEKFRKFLKNAVIIPFIKICQRILHFLYEKLIWPILIVIGYTLYYIFLAIYQVTRFCSRIFGPIIMKILHPFIFIFLTLFGFFSRIFVQVGSLIISMFMQIGSAIMSIFGK